MIEQINDKKLIHKYTKQKKELENKIENYLVEKCKKLDILCLKFTSPSLNGVPDRILISDNYPPIFVELKRENEKPRPQQNHVINEFKKRNVEVYVIDTKQSVDKLINKIKKGDETK